MIKDDRHSVGVMLSIDELMALDDFRWWATDAEPIRSGPGIVEARACG